MRTCATCSKPIEDILDAISANSWLHHRACYKKAPKRAGKPSSEEATNTRAVLEGRIAAAVMRVVDAARALAKAEGREFQLAASADPERKELRLARTHLFKLIREYGIAGAGMEYRRGFLLARGIFRRVAKGLTVTELGGVFADATEWLERFGKVR